MKTHNSKLASQKLITLHIMLYEGLSRINAQRLCHFHIQLCDKDKRDENENEALESFYTKHKVMINATVFEDSFDGFHFWGFISESIKKSHQNLPFILRNQYSNSGVVYSYLLETYHDTRSSKECLIQAILDAPQEIMSDFARDVYRFIILPPLHRHHIYSPIMGLLLFVDILHVMADTYIQKTLGVEGKKKLIMYMDAPFSKEQLESICWMSTIEKRMLIDESEVHSTQIKKANGDRRNRNK